MQIFLFLNDLAGRWPVVDALMRGVYVGTIPVLAVLLLALLTLFPRGFYAPAREKIALATVLALLGATGLMWGVGALAHALNLGTISPRPFMTRWVNLLIVEPQDNSFPCSEMMVAAILGVGIGLAHRRWGVFAAVATLLLGVARLFCGSNYGADIAVGALLGVALMLPALALCRAFGARRARIQGAAWGAGLLAATLLGCFLVGSTTPRFERELQLPWGASASAASPGALTQRVPVAARPNLQEGEGVATPPLVEALPGAGEAESLALSKRQAQFLPAVERYLRGVLEPRARPFKLLDVEVAPVNWKGESYRCAALRFEVEPNTPDARRLVAARAMALVKAAFGADSRLDNVDVTAIMRGDARALDNSEMNFAGDEVPIFTASIQRRNLIVAAPRWANDPRLDAGLWLRARSRLWINDRVLPVVAAPTPAPTLAAPVAPLPTPDATLLPTANATLLPTPNATPKTTLTAPKAAPLAPVAPKTAPIAPKIAPVMPKTAPTSPFQPPASPLKTVPEAPAFLKPTPRFGAKPLAGASKSVPLAPRPLAPSKLVAPPKPLVAPRFALPVRPASTPAAVPTTAPRFGPVPPAASP